jgi:hypothetical protein
MMEMTRAEYMKWCKFRALEYVDAGQLDNAISSILSDFTKHPETKPLTSDFGMMGLVAMRQGEDAVRKFITGFAE